MLNGDVHRGLHDPNARAPIMHHDSNHADAYHAGRKLEQLSIATSQAPKARLCTKIPVHKTHALAAYCLPWQEA